MSWSDALERAIETQLDGLAARDLAHAAEAVSQRYRGTRGGTTATWSRAERLAYLAVRAPATYAAVQAVLRELQLRMRAQDIGGADPDEAIRSLLDLGAGPGVGLWAAAEQLDTLREATLVERDSESIALGRAIARDAGLDRRVAANWRHADLRDLRSRSGDAALPLHDLVLLSYSLGELDDRAAAALVDVAWGAARVVLIIVEPGTPRHFARLLAARQRVIDAGARIAAPCPHARACPMAAPDWCHFAARLSRTRLHRRLKQGALSYEDEKFSYVIALRDATRSRESHRDVARVSESAFSPPPARIVRRPERHKGFVRLPLCADEGLRTVTVTRSQREAYRQARDASWGDVWTPR